MKPYGMDRLQPGTPMGVGVRKVAVPPASITSKARGIGSLLGGRCYRVRRIPERAARHEGMLACHLD